MLAYVTTPDDPSGIALRDVPEPVARPEQAVVAVSAVSLNRGESNHIRTVPPGTVMGWDLAGVVERAAADGSGPPAGTAVFGYSTERGSWAERVAVPTMTLALRPEGVSVAAASTLGVAGLTALYALQRVGSLLGRTVLVTGAAGGVGRLAVQLAVRSGARVVAVVGDDPARADAVTSLGLDGVTLERGLSPDGPPAHLILESVGGDSLTAAFRRVAQGGTIVMFGRSSMQPGTVPADWYFKDARLEGLPYSADHAADRFPPRGLEVQADLVGRGLLDPGIGLENDWRELPAAVGALLDRKVSGKAVLHIGPGTK
jgi:NADPH:quinone reductase-like Zn-dependent oxidoreductase